MKNSAFYLVHTAKVFVMRKLGFLLALLDLTNIKMDVCQAQILNSLLRRGDRTRRRRTRF